MLEDERPGSAFKRAGDALDGDIASGVLDRRAPGKHLAATRALEIAVELLLDRHSAQHGVRRIIVHRQRLQRYFEWSSGAAHDSNLQPG